MTKVLLFGTIGWSEVLIIAFIVLLLFGGKKIPELMKGLGKGVRSFKDGMKEVENEVNKVDAEIKETDNQEKK
ncbi:MAG: twin-arginine translocase TatA/TatE family subunit [Bacteroidales bacterium]|nr:twin-arginine translocase TatA/TatE family subunit [Bacteroidales bacterium]